MLIQTGRGSLSLVAGCCWVNSVRTVPGRENSSGWQLFGKPSPWLKEPENGKDKPTP